MGNVDVKRFLLLFLVRIQSVAGGHHVYHFNAISLQGGIDGCFAVLAVLQKVKQTVRAGYCAR